MTEQHTCCEIVWHKDWGKKFTPCGKNAKHQHNNKWYCGFHNPIAVAERNRKRSEEYDR